MNKLSWTVLLVASMAGIAAMYPILKLLDGTVEPLLLTFFRFSIASIALAPLIFYRRTFKVPTKKELALFAFIAVCAVIPTALIVIGIERTNSIVSAILVNANPLIIATLSPFLISEHVNTTKKIALGIGFLGVISVILNGHEPSALIRSEYFWGSVILLLAALSGALNKIYSRDLVRKYDGLYVTFLAVVLGSLMLAATLILQEGFAPVSQFPLTTFLLLLALGIICTAIPWTTWNNSLKHLDVHVAASFSLLIPIFATLYSLLLFEESLTVWIIMGLFLTSVGVYIVQREEKIVPTV